MKLSNFKVVDRLVKIRNECLAALDQAAEYEFDEDKEPFNDGYSFAAGQHADRSGFSIDMNGCYVAAEVTRAIIIVLQSQIIRVEAQLSELGVEVT